jgi:N-acetylglucosamine-6-sulfatase
MTGAWRRFPDSPEGLYRAGALKPPLGNGYFYGEHGLGAQRRLAYEETIRIPLVIRYPRVTKAGSTPSAMALSLEIAPTLLAVAGLEPGAHIQGRSLLPVLAGDTGEWRSSFLIEYYTDTVFTRIRNMGYVAARTSKYKYINYLELPGMHELYDLENDPFEKTNLVASADAGRTRASDRPDRLPDTLAVTCDL